MTTSFKRQPKLGGLYERLMVIVHSYGDGLIEQDYAILRETGAEWRRVSDYELGGDPLFLWDITESEKDPEVLHYHFLWKGRIKLYATIAKDEDFFRWFDVCWELKETKK